MTKHPDDTKHNVSTPNHHESNSKEDFRDIKCHLLSTYTNHIPVRTYSANANSLFQLLAPLATLQLAHNSPEIRQKSSLRATSVITQYNRIEQIFARAKKAQIKTRIKRGKGEIAHFSPVHSNQRSED